MKTTNAGATWTKVFDGYSQSLYGFVNNIIFPNQDTGYANFSNGGQILRTFNGGATWQAISINPGGQGFLYFTTPLKGVATGINNYSIVRTTNAGQSWAAATITGITASDMIIDIMMPDTSNGYAITNGSNPKIFKTTNGGVSWNLVTSSGINDFGWKVFFTSPDTGYVSTHSGVFKTVNSGVNWSKLTVPVNEKADIFFNDNRHGCIVTELSQILVTGDGGTSWSQSDTGHRNYLYRMIHTGHGTLYAIGSVRTFKSTDSGQTWIPQMNLTGVSFSGAYFTDSLNGHICGSNGTYRRTTNGGTTWFSSSTTLPTSSLYALSFTSASVGYMGSQDGRLFRTANGGVSWTAVSTGVTLSIGDINFPNADTGYAVGGTGLVMRTTDAGLTWTRLTNTITNYLSCAYFFDGRTGYACGGRVLYKTTDAGVTWTSTNPGFGDNIQALYFMNRLEGYMLQSQYNGLIYRTSDGGKTWLLINSSSSATLTDLAVMGDKLVAVGYTGKTLLVEPGIQAPVLPAAQTQRCGPGPVTVSATGVPGKTTTWYSDPLFLTVLATGDTATLSFTQTDTVYVAVYDSGLMCESYRKPLIIKIDQPQVIISPSGSHVITQGDSILFSASPSTYSSYQWKRNNVAVNHATSGSFYAKDAGSYTVEVTNGPGCAGASNAVTLNVNPVPVSWLGFTAQKKSGDEVSLNWKTASENNNHYFEVQRSGNMKEWSGIAIVQGKGNSSTVNAYAITDDVAGLKNVPVIYYRIRQVDYDAQHSFSHIAAVNNQRTAFSLYLQPNPYSSDACIVLVNNYNRGEVNIVITDLNGKVLSARNRLIEAGDTTIELKDASSLVEGMYFVSVQYQGKTEVLKLIKR